MILVFVPVEGDGTTFYLACPSGVLLSSSVGQYYPNPSFLSKEISKSFFIPELRPGSLDKNSKMNRKTKNITTM